MFLGLLLQSCVRNHLLIRHLNNVWSLIDMLIADNAQDVSLNFK